MNFPEKNNVAVLLIDMQEFFLKRLTTSNRDRIIFNQSKVLDFCLKKHIPVFVLNYKGRGELIKTLREKLGSRCIEIAKEFNSGFRKTNLEVLLQNIKVKELLLMGINASACVQDNAISALNRGYKIITSGAVIASSSKRDECLVTSRKWYPRKGLYFTDVTTLKAYLNNK